MFVDQAMKVGVLQNEKTSIISLTTNGLKIFTTQCKTYQDKQKQVLKSVGHTSWCFVTSEVDCHQCWKIN